MLLRALFSIGLVAALLPHEPDLGYGRPGDGNGVAAVVRDVLQINVARVGREIHAARTGTVDNADASDTRALLAQASQIISSLGADTVSASQDVDRIRDIAALRDKVEKLNTLRADDPAR